jgi:hypothetical protein
MQDGLSRQSASAARCGEIVCNPIRLEANSFIIVRQIDNVALLKMAGVLVTFRFGDRP